jgi:hypothetical protein
VDQSVGKIPEEEEDVVSLPLDEDESEEEASRLRLPFFLLAFSYMEGRACAA